MLVVFMACAGAATGEGESVEPWAGSITPGFIAGDDVFESEIDILLPVYAWGAGGVVLINPRASFTDNSEEEVNFGAVYRHLLPMPFLADQQMIVGGNVYYDSRWTAENSHFNQAGAGIEILTRWVDFRANYYLPEDDTELIDTREEETVIGSTARSEFETAAAGNSILETRRTTRTETVQTDTFETFEGTLEGYDIEIGGLIPIPLDWLETRLFLGYYHFEPNLDVPDVEGWKARLEVRALPALLVDAELFMNDEFEVDATLFEETEYLVGARLQIPFNAGSIFQGKNPFEGFVAAFKPAARPFAGRLVENIIRDPHVQVCQQTVQTFETEVWTTKSRRVDAVALPDGQDATDVTFVSAVRGRDGGAGTFEDPVDDVQEGVDKGTAVVYVEAAEYRQGVGIDRSVTLVGEGQPLGTGGTFGGGAYPTIDGVGTAPAAVRVTGGEKVSIMGFDLANTTVANTTVAKATIDSIDDLDNYGMVVALFENTKHLFFHNNVVHDAVAGLVALYDDVAGFTATVSANTFHNLGLGIGVGALDSSGSVGIEWNTMQDCIVANAVGGMGKTTALATSVSHNKISGSGVDLDDIIPTALLTDLLVPTFSKSQAVLDLPVIPQSVAVLLGTMDQATMQAKIEDNDIDDYLGAVVLLSIYGGMQASVADNDIVGGGRNAIYDAVDDLFKIALPVGDPTDTGLFGVLSVAAGAGSVMDVSIAGNSIDKEIVGVGVFSAMGADVDASITGNDITGGGFGPYLAELLWDVPAALFGEGGSAAGIVLASIAGEDTPFGPVSSSLDASVVGNTLTDHVVSFSATSVMGANMSLDVTDNEFTGGALGQILGSDLDFGAIGMLLVAHGGYYDATLGWVPSTIAAGGSVSRTSTDVNGSIARNTIDGHMIGIGASAISGADMDLDIHQNDIAFADIGAGLDLDALGVAGIVLTTFGMAPVANGLNPPGPSHIDYDIWDNSIDDCLLGVGVFSISQSSSSGRIRDNDLDDCMVGVAVVGVGDAMVASEISGNDIDGGNADTVIDLFAPGALATDVGIVGIVVAGIGDGTRCYASISNNNVGENAMGIAAVNMSDAEMAVEIVNNTVQGNGLADDIFKGEAADFGLFGIGVFNIDGSNLNTRIAGNTVNDEVLGIGVLATGGVSNSLTTVAIENNTVNNSWIGIAAAGFYDAVLDLSIMGNTVSGTFNHSIVDTNFGLGGIVLASGEDSTVTGDINGNTVRDNSGIGLVAFVGTDGWLGNDDDLDASTMDIDVWGNTIRDNQGPGLAIVADYQTAFVGNDDVGVGISGNTFVNNAQSALIPAQMKFDVIGLSYDDATIDATLNNNTSDTDFWFLYDLLGAGGLTLEGLGNNHVVNQLGIPGGPPDLPFPDWDL